MSVERGSNRYRFSEGFVTLSSLCLLSVALIDIELAGNLCLLSVAPTDIDLARV